MYNRFHVYLASAISALGGFLFGYDTGVISGAVLFVRNQFALTHFGVEIVVSAVLLGAVIGAAGAGVLSDRLGRRRLLILAAGLFTASSLICACAPTIPWLAAGRILVGLAIGCASMTSPLYIAEIAPPAIRGRLVSLSQLAVTIGIVMSYLVDYLFAESRGWRAMFGIAAIPSAALGIGMFFLPESPRWLIRHGFKAKALDVLTEIHGKKMAAQEVREIERHAKRSTLKQAMTPWLRRALVIGIGLAVFQQFTGINTVIYYAPTIFELAGFHSAEAAILATFGVGVVNVLATVAALWLLDKAGRRMLLLTGLGGMVISLAMLGLLFSRAEESAVYSWMTLICLMVYVAAFAMSLGPVFWLMISEIYPLKARGRAMSIATIANWGSNLVVALTFLTLIRVMGKSVTFWFYGAVGLAAWVFSYYLVPETKGRALEQISKGNAHLHSND